MTIDLSVLYGSASTTSSTGTQSALAAFKKLQATAEANQAADSASTTAEKLAAQLRDIDNAGIQTRNAQYKQINAQVESDQTYFQNRIATATSVDELLSDNRFLKVIAYANGYGDTYTTNPQHLRDILTSDLNDPNSVARQGSVQDLELAKKYNFGATGTLTDTNGNAVGLDASGNIVNDNTAVTPLPASLAKLRNITVNSNGFAQLDPSGNLVIAGNVGNSDANAYSKALSKTLLTEETAPDSTDTSYEYDSEDYQRYIQRTDVQTDVQYFKDNIGSVKTEDDLFKNTRLLNFILKAYDLESDEQYPGKIRQILDSDLTDVNSLANRFQDPRYQQLAKDFDFFNSGTTKLTSSSTVDSIVNKYQQTSYEQNLDEQAPGVRVAIEFERRIKDVTSTVQVLGDSVLREVITTANYIPPELAYQDTDAQVATVEKKVNVTDLAKDPTAAEKLVERYLAIKDSGSSGSSGNSYLLDLFA
ncbi:DUF1217 domain-containing protein [Ferrovibrio xuzhouensis]|uniref:DUF1217 domain-containing protein n=1 Tax=Ferrovibrio xuzhouensis TaxID=1576914 RepID=A0ABV7VIW3_9PROT